MSFIPPIERAAGQSVSSPKDHRQLSANLLPVQLLADEAGEITLRRDYKPFGELDRSAGDGVTHFGFTGEWGEGYVLDGETCGNWNGIESYDCSQSGPLHLS